MEPAKLQFRQRMPIDSYGGGGFRFGGVQVDSSVLLLSDRLEPLTARHVEDISTEALELVFADAGNFDFLLLGAGPAIAFPPLETRRALEEAGISVELMDTASACRTYNVLIAEERRVAAALIAVD